MSRWLFILITASADTQATAQFEYN